MSAFTPKLNRTIPGQMTDAELLRLAELAHGVPPGGVIVEIGPLYGLSTWHLAQHCDPSVTVFCIDPWQRERWIIEAVEEAQGAPPFSRAEFERYTADCRNIVMLQGYSPQVAAGWQLPIDLFVDDAVHENPTLGQSLAFWSSRLKPGGVASGHDCCDQWPDVRREATALAASWPGAELVVVDSLWSVMRPLPTVVQPRAARPSASQAKPVAKLATKPAGKTVQPPAKPTKPSVKRPAVAASRRKPR